MTLFVTIAIVGAIILVISALGGEHEFGADHDVGFDHDHDMGHDTGHAESSGPSPWSIRVLSLFVTAFGAVGAIAQSYGASPMQSSIAGFFAGIVFAFVGWQLLRLFWSQQGSSTVSSEDLLGTTGMVFTPIPPRGVGEITVVVRGQSRHYPARARDGIGILKGVTICIVEFPADVAIVEAVITSQREKEAI